MSFITRTNKKNEAYIATQQMLIRAELEETAFWEQYLPDAIVAQFRNKKEKVKSKEVMEVEQRLDKADKLEPYLDQQKMKFDEKYGTRTTKEHLCLFCSNKEISIVSLNSYTDIHELWPCSLLC